MKLMTVLLLVVAAQAQTGNPARVKLDRQRQDEDCARKSGLTVADIRALRTQLGIADDSAGFLSLLDAKSLRQRNHVLVTEAGNGHCLRIHVLEPAGSGFREVWMLSELPGRGWPTDEPATPRGRGICTQSPKQPVVRVTEGGRIELTVTALSDPFQRTMSGTAYIYSWNGTTYVQQQGQ